MRTVLFLGIGNATRTQMAEAILRQRAAHRFTACSAGLMPRGVDPMTRLVLAEAGADTDGLTAKHLRSFLGRMTVHYAIILSRPEEPCSPRVYPFALNVLSWPFDDPSTTEGGIEERLNVFRRVRDQIDKKIQDWLGTEATREAESVATFQPRLKAGGAASHLVSEVQFVSPRMRSALSQPGCSG